VTAIVSLTFFVSIIQIRRSLHWLLKNPFKQIITYYLDLILMVAAGQLLFSGLDYIQAGFAEAAQAERQARELSAPRMFWHKLAIYKSTFEKEEEDRVYSFPRRTEASEVLIEIVAFACKILRLMYLILCIAVYLNLHANYIQIALFVEALGMVMFYQNLADSYANLSRLTWSRPFYLGDFVSVGLQGREITKTEGFVETITWSHIVIRTFDNSQTWLHHKVLTSSRSIAKSGRVNLYDNKKPDYVVFACGCRGF
jgi:hypothetical protein